MKKILVLLMILGTWVIFFSGCASTQATQFYLLSSLNKPQAPAKATVKTANLALGIGPINIPRYLDRPQIVTRTSRNALALAEFHNWAEQLEINITQVMAENLSILLATDQIELFPWQRQHPIDYQLVMDVIQFDRNQDGEAILLARWSLMDGKGRPLVTERKSLLATKPKGQDYESLVAALSKNLVDLSREIANVIQSLSSKE